MMHLKLDLSGEEVTFGAMKKFVALAEQAGVTDDQTATVVYPGLFQGSVDDNELTVAFYA